MLKRLTLATLLLVTSSAVLAQYDNQKMECSPPGNFDMTILEVGLMF